MSTEPPPPPPVPSVESLGPWRWPRITVPRALGLLAGGLVFGLWQGSTVWLTMLGDGSDTPASRPFMWEVTGAIAGWVASPILFTAVLNAPSPRGRWGRFLGLHAAAFVVFCAVHLPVMLGIRHVLYGWLGWGAYHYGPLGFRIPMELQKDLIAYSLAALLVGLVSSWRDRQQRELTTARLAAELKASQLQALTAQLDPHFLFNALNTVSAVMYQDLARTDRLIDDLGQLLRASLERGGTTWSLEEERAHAERFLGLLTARFGDRLRIRWELAPGLEQVQVPRFALQLLVENAVKHNQDRPGPLEVRIRARARESDWTLEVEDTGRGLGGEGSPASGPGVGLAHLARVLDLLHGARAALERGSGPEGGARVTLRLPREATA